MLRRIFSARPPKNATGASLPSSPGSTAINWTARLSGIRSSDRESLGILGDHVTLEQGTGAVHTAPGHGQEDYVVGMQYGLPVYCPVDPAGRFFEAEGVNAGTLLRQLIGKTVWEGNPIVIEILKEHGALLAMENIDHSYPHCWRCHNPTIFRATDQWFIGMDNNNLRQKALDAIKGVKWMPEWGEERLTNMVSSRPDWCISRQRVWGVPIVVFYCSKACREASHGSQDSIERGRPLCEETFRRLYGSNAPPPNSCRPAPVCTKCAGGGGVFERERHSRRVVRFPAPAISPF